MLKERLVELNKELQEVLEERKEVATKLFHDGCKELFEKYPELTSFGWTQYTPYWNDGDTCYFSVHTDYPYINGKDWDDTAYIAPDKYDDSNIRPYCQAVYDFLNEFDDDLYKEMFGDHAKVTVTKDGIETESYNHD